MRCGRRGALVRRIPQFMLLRPDLYCGRRQAGLAAVQGRHRHAVHCSVRLSRPYWRPARGQQRICKLAARRARGIFLLQYVDVLRSGRPCSSRSRAFAAACRWAGWWLWLLSPVASRNLLFHLLQLALHDAPLLHPLPAMARRNNREQARIARRHGSRRRRHASRGLI